MKDRTRIMLYACIGALIGLAFGLLVNLAFADDDKPYDPYDRQTYEDYERDRQERDDDRRLRETEERVNNPRDRLCDDFEYCQ